MGADDKLLQKCNEMNYKKIKDPVYETDIWCVWDCDKDELVEWVYKKFKLQIEAITLRGRVLDLENDGVSAFIIYFHTAEWTLDFITLLNHELMHLTSFILSYCLIKLCDETEECYAYFSSYLCKQILLTIFKRDIYD